MLRDLPCSPAGYFVDPHARGAESEESRELEADGQEKDELREVR